MSLIGTALGAWNTSFGYNKDKYKFDEEQAQKGRFGRWAFDILRWQLFRNDIRDLFFQTTANMKSIMVFGTIFTGFTIEFITMSLHNFPTEPPWLVVLWLHCACVGLVYGLTGLWLAVHGNISAQALYTQMMTQVVRPPIPTEEEVFNNTFWFHEYEADASLHFKVPNMFGIKSTLASVFEDTAGTDAAAHGATDGIQAPASSLESVDSSAPVRSSSTFSSLSRSPSLGRVHSLRLQREKSSGSVIPGQRPARSRSMDSLMSGKTHSDDFSAACPACPTAEKFEEWGEPIGSAPGSRATDYGHVHFFAEMQGVYAHYHAYAMVCLHSYVTQILFSFCYYILSVSVKRKGVELWDHYILWGLTGMLSYTCYTLAKLDLYVPTGEMRVMQFLLVCGPIVSGIAMQLEERYGRMWYTYILLIITFMFHLVHTWYLLLKQATPEQRGELMLPMKYRGVRHMEVTMPMEHFHALSVTETTQVAAQRVVDDGPGEIEMVVPKGIQPQMSQTLSGSLHTLPEEGASEEPSDREVQLLQSKLARALESQFSEKLTVVELRSLAALRERLRLIVGPLTADVNAGEWLRVERVLGSGIVQLSFLNVVTGKVREKPPDVGAVIDVLQLSKDVESVVSRLTSSANSSSRRLGSKGRDKKRHKAKRALAGWRRSLAGSNEHIELPWRIFQRVSWFVMFSWVIAIICAMWLQFEFSFGGSGDTGTEAKTTTPPLRIALAPRQLETVWPHQRFKITAIACGGGLMVVSDRFEIYALDIPTRRGLEESPLELRPLLSAKHLPFAWTSLALVCGEGREERLSGCSALLLLEKGGKAVWEQPLPVAGRPTAQPHRWPLDASSAPLRSIAVESGSAIHCGKSTVNWELVGFRDVADAAAVCLADGELRPRRIAGAGACNFSESAKGFCELPSGDGFVVPGLLGRSSNLSAELWHVHDLGASHAQVV